MTSTASLFSSDEVDLPRLRERAYGMRWATHPHDVIPLTAAEPDFAVATPIRDAVKDYLDGGLLSYAPAQGLPEFRAAAATMLTQRRGLRSEPDRIFATDGVASAMHLVARLVLGSGDEVIIFDPVDFLFKRCVEAAGGRVLHCPVDPSSGALDLDALHRIVTDRTRMIAICNPLNPVGRVLSHAELDILGTFAVEHGLWLMADEVWSDIVYAPRRHISIATLSPEIAACTLTLMGTSKSFGLSGVRAGFIHAPSADMVERLAELSGARVTAYGVSTLAQVAAVAAWTEGHAWLQDFLRHLERMRDLLVEGLNAIEGVSCRCPEGTYVAFVDVRGLGLDAEVFAEELLRKARVAVVPGTPRWFGPGARGHVRMCFATSDAILDEALERIHEAVQTLRRSHPSA